MKLSITTLLASTFMALGCHHRLPASPAAATLPEVTAIAFGSCSDQKRPQPLWDDIRQQQPQVWIWLGDNIYGDSENMDTLKAKYDRQRSDPKYRKLCKSTRIIGVWDDHDYGVNDGGKEYPRKMESQQLMLDFLDVDQHSPLRQQEGAFSVHTFGHKGHKVKVILLDGRYFRDPLKKEGKKNIPDPSGDMLGKAQWRWLEQQLRGSDADIHIIGCGIQFLAEDHPYEKWANFPTARKRLLDLISGTQPKGLFLISGDRHIAEVSGITLPGLGYTLYDITSSGLTHVSKSHDEPNRHRIGDMITQLNYGLIRINWDKQPLSATIQIKGDDNATYLEQEITFQGGTGK